MRSSGWGCNPLVGILIRRGRDNRSLSSSSPYPPPPKHTQRRSHLQAKDRGLTQAQPCWHLNPGLAAFSTVSTTCLRDWTMAAQADRLFPSATLESFGWLKPRWENQQPPVPPEILSRNSVSDTTYGSEFLLLQSAFRQGSTGIPTSPDIPP